MKLDFHSEIAGDARNYYIPHGYYNEMDFREVFTHLYTLKKRISRFILTGEINERELLNDIIFITNNFDVDFFLKFSMKNYPQKHCEVVKSLLLFLGIITDDQYDVQSNRIVDSILSDVRERFGLPMAYHKP